MGVSWTVCAMFLLTAAAVQVIYGASKTEAEINEEKKEGEKDGEGDREKEIEGERGMSSYSRRSVLVLERRTSHTGVEAGMCVHAFACVYACVCMNEYFVNLSICLYVCLMYVYLSLLMY